MAPTDFIDVEVTGHAKSSKKSKDKRNKEKQKTKIKETARTKEILMPAISPSMTKGKVVEWLVKTGDTIRKGEPIMVIESEKEIQGARGYRMNQDVNANVDGVLAAIYQHPGQSVDVGAVLGIIVPDQIIDVEIDNGTVDVKVENETDDETKKKNATATTSTTSTAEDDENNENDDGDKNKDNNKEDTDNDDDDDVLAATTATVNEEETMESTSGPDWVHGHHADAGPVSEQPFYRTSTSTFTVDNTGSPSKFSTPFTGRIDNTDAFYGPYSGAKPPPPPPTPKSADRLGDSFYEAYKEKDVPRDLIDPFAAQANQWHQHPNGANNMGPYPRGPPPGADFFTGEPRGPPPDDPFNKPFNPNNAAERVSSRDHQFVRGEVTPPQPTMMEEEEETPTMINTPYQSKTTNDKKQQQQQQQQQQQKQDEKEEQEVQNAFSKSTGLPSEEDLARLSAMEQRIVNLEQQSQQQIEGEDSSIIFTQVQDELATLRAGLVDLQMDYDQKVKNLEDSYQNSLLQVGRDFTETVEELRDWDSITVTWDIEDFEKSLRNDLTTYTSEEFTVAGYAMTLEMQIFGPNDEGSRDVGFYIMHTGGLNFVPIMIGKSKITIQASGNGNSNDAVKVFVDDASIEDSHYGWGWKKFFSLKDLRQSFVNSKGEIQVSATVRVKRVRSCRLATAL